MKTTEWIAQIAENGDGIYSDNLRQNSNPLIQNGPPIWKTEYKLTKIDIEIVRK